MKVLKALTTAVMMVISLSSFAGEDLPPSKEISIGLSEVFVPGGFDSESDAYVVGSGLFPNSCYSWNRAEVNHMRGNIHEIQSVATVSQGMCLMVLVPFTKEIRLGRLSSGNHTLRFLNGDGTYFEKALRIE